MPTRMNPKDFMSFINMVKSNDPQQFVMNMLQERADTNPIAQNLLGLVQSGNTADVEKVVRNIAKEKGIDFDKEFNSFKQTFKF